MKERWWKSNSESVLLCKFEGVEAVLNPFLAKCNKSFPFFTVKKIKIIIIFLQKNLCIENNTHCFQSALKVYFNT